MFNIHVATEEDIPNICTEGIKFVAYYGIDWDEDSVVEMLTYLVNEGVVFVAYKENVFAGFICGHAGVNPWNKGHTVLRELAWWVVSEFRGSSVGIRLLMAFEEAANGLPIAMTTLPQTEIKSNLMDKLGYKLVEYVWLKG